MHRERHPPEQLPATLPLAAVVVPADFFHLTQPRPFGTLARVQRCLARPVRIDSDGEVRRWLPNSRQALCGARALPRHKPGADLHASAVASAPALHLFCEHWPPFAHSAACAHAAPGGFGTAQVPPLGSVQYKPLAQLPSSQVSPLACLAEQTPALQYASATHGNAVHASPTFAAS